MYLSLKLDTFPTFLFLALFSYLFLFLTFLELYFH